MTTLIASEQISMILDALWDRDCSCEETQTTTIDGPKVISTYSDIEGNLRFAIQCELALANSLGAALTMIPAGGAEDATSEGVVPDNIADNVREILNICSTVFADFHEQRIVLDQMITPGQQLDEELANRIGDAKPLCQMKYQINGYQSGEMQLLQIQ